MKKRILSMLLALVTLLSMLPIPANAASTLDEAMAEVNVYGKKEDLNWLTMNGSVKVQHYTYYNYRSPFSGETKEIPAYCVDPNLYGVPALAPDEGTPIKYSASETGNNPKIMGIIANGYPHIDLGTLGVNTIEEAYYATKTALWCYLLPNWDISKLGINPALSGEERAAAERVLEATKSAYTRGMRWNALVEPKLTATPDRETAYPVTINGEQCYQQVFKVTSETWSYEPVLIELAEGAPSGARILDMNNNPVGSLSIYDATNGNDGYSWSVKVVYPKSSIEGQTGTCRLSLRSTVVQYEIYFAKTLERDTYGNIQEYMLDTDPYTTVTGSAVSSYSSTPTTEEDDGGTGLRIRKLETGTEMPLPGAIFEVTYPDGSMVGSLVTDNSGLIYLPLEITGNYTVTELSPPKDHLLPELRTQSVMVTHENVAEVTFYNDPYGGIRVEKYSDTGEPLRGVTVQIKHIASGETWSGQTGAAGVIEFQKIPIGGYEVRETAGIRGWQFDGETVKTVSVTSGATSTVTFINRELPGLRIVKYDLTTHQPLPNVTFEIFKDGLSIGKYTTDAMGEIVLTNLEPGTYLVKEVATDDDHVVDSTPQEIELKAGDGIRELVFFNSLKPGMHLVKVDSITMKPLPNVRFEFKLVGGSYRQEFTTDINGEIDLSKLEPGTYEVRELEAPSGYLMDDSVRVIKIEPDQVASFVFTNTPKPSLKIVKVSSDGTPLAGVHFRIAKIEDGTHYLDRITDSNGEILIDGMIENLEPGVYSVQETATTSDHILDLREYHVELFPGKLSTITIENQKRPNLVVIKRDADTGEVIKDTVFEVRAADGHSVDEIRTDANGRATLDNLLPGVYQITEKSVPADWLLDAPSQLVTLYPNRDHTVFFNDHRKPSLTVNKVDSITGSPIKGAKFEVWYASNNTVTGELNSLGTYYSDENGQFTLTRLRDGWYRVTELEPAAGYVIKDPATQEFYIKGGEDKTIVFENTPKSAVIVQKYDSVTGEALPGCTFQLRYLAGASGTGGTVIGQKVTGKNGTIIWTGLQPGTYIVEEVDPTDGYSIIQSSETIFLADNGEQSVVTVTFYNAPDGQLLIRKVCAVNPSVTLQNAEFKVMYADGTLIGDSNGVYRTDENGEILITGLKPGKSVVATETRAPDGYIIDTQSQTVQIKEGKTVSLTFKNQPKGALVIQKRDSATGEPLPGAQFRVTTAAGCEVGLDGVIGTSTLTQNGIFTTDAQGEIRISNLGPGAYVLTEIKAPTGYVMDSASTNVVIGQGGDTQMVVITNSKTGTLIIDKRDSLTGKPLEGVTFKVTTSTGEFVPNENGQISSNGLYFTDKDGKITINGVVGTLVVTETATLPGYTIDEASRTQTVVVNPNDTQTLYFTNTPSTTLAIEKYVEGTTTPIQGVTFLITDSSGAVVGRSNGEFITDENGRIVIDDLTPGTTVTAREVKTVEGFVLDATPKSILIKAGEVMTLRFYNQKQGTIVIRKLDKQTGEPLPGVEFEITYSDGSYLDDDYGHLSSKGLYTTDQNGEIRISGVVGTLVITETKTLPGYVMDDATKTQTVKVNPGDTQTITVYNTKVGGLELIKVSAADKSKRLEGVTFEIRKMDGALVDTVTTGKNGRVHVSLDAGSYYAVEIEGLSGFKVDTTPQYFEVKDGETTTLTVTNMPYSGIEIHKIDAVTGEGIYGVSFLLYDSQNNVVGQYTSDDRGYVRIEEIAAGRYRVRELENPGYIVDTQLKTVEVKSGEVTLVEWKNTPITGQIQILKTSEDYNSMNGWSAGTPIPNTVFEVYNFRTGNLVDTIRTDKNGIASTRPLPLGRYKLAESQAADFYALDKTPIEVEIEFAGQIVKAAMTNKSLYTNVSVTKRGYVEVMPGQMIRYDFSNIANNSTTALESFYWRDTLPTNAVRLDKIVTGTWNASGNYKIVYKTNYSGDEHRVLADNLATNRSYILNASPAALGLASGEYVTEFMAVFGVVPSNFRQVEAPQVYCTVLSTLSNGTEFVNVTDVGGLYNGQWIMAVDRWTTRVYAPSKPLPRTGY